MYDSFFLAEALQLQQEGVSFCAVSIVDARGSIPQEIGAKAIFTGDGLMYGTIGGGRVEAHALQQALGLLSAESRDRTRFERLNLARDLAMTCAGELALFYEVHRPDLAWSIVIFGAGHVAQKLCRLLVEFDCRVTCVDTRPQWLDRLPKSGKLEKVLVANYADAVNRVHDGAVVVIMTMGHTTDLPILRAIQAHGLMPSYLGVIGSDTKAKILRRQLLGDGLPADFVASIICPIGEKLGDNSPPEIAVSVVAQLLRLRKHGSPVD